MPWYRNRRGEQLWYEEQGEGRNTLILLHGWCMSSAVWKYQFDEFSPSLRILAPDLRGHGRSRLKIPGGCDFVTLAHDLVDFFAALGLADAVLAGWSMGAQVALQAYADLRCRLAGLILVSATPRFTASADFPCGLPGKEADGMRLKMQRSMSRALTGFHARLFSEDELEHHPSAVEITQLLEGIPYPDHSSARDALDALIGADMRGLVTTITSPTLVIHGTQDRICLPQASRYLKEHISGAVQAELSGCGHAPFLTQSAIFNAECARFMRSSCNYAV